MSALCAAYGVDTTGRELALLCQKAENLVVGAPCGVMDQMASALGEEGRLLALLCQPAEVQGCVPLPCGAKVWGIDSVSEGPGVGHRDLNTGCEEPGPDRTGMCERGVMHRPAHAALRVLFDP
eukprot:351594-Chlamydomonas_euryale.AAC.3